MKILIIIKKKSAGIYSIFIRETRTILTWPLLFVCFVMSRFLWFVLSFSFKYFDQRHFHTQLVVYIPNKFYTMFLSQYLKKKYKYSNVFSCIYNLEETSFSKWLNVYLFLKQIYKYHNCVIFHYYSIIFKKDLFFCFCELLFSDRELSSNHCNKN